mgnify:CR=1 FL=1
MSKKINMTDIAKRLGISKVSVSKALNDKEGVSEELREKVKLIAQEMGYRINTVARGLKTQKVSNVGILIAEHYVSTKVNNHVEQDKKAYYFDLYGLITKKLDELGYSSVMELLTKADEDSLELPRMYNEHKIDGLIVLGQLDNRYLKKLETIDIPLVYLDFYVDFSKVDSIVVDNFYSSYLITNSLIKLGHKKIGFIGTIWATSSIQDRYLGYYKALIENGIPLNMDYVIDDRNSANELIDIVLPKELPTAFVCNCDLVAYNLIRKLDEMGLKVPDDISVVGFDNSIFATLANPQLTTVDHNVDEMIDTCVKVITKKIANPKKTYGRILIQGKIVERDSVKSLI